MRMGLALAAATAGLLAGCSAAEDEGVPAPATETIASKSPSAPRADETGAPDAIKVTLPQLAYAYSLSYLLPGNNITEAQDAHRELCEEMGPARCQLLALERGTGEESSARALLKLRVATAEARRFQILLDHAVTQVGGRAGSASIATEDVSKQIVDAEARIRQRELLVARLTDALRNAKGKPSELVDAERSITRAQEELDQARAWLAENRGRVAMSEFTIGYGAVAPSLSTASLGSQLSEAAQGSGAVFMIGLRALLSIAIYLHPWALLLGLPLLLVRQLRKRSAAVPDHA